MACPTPTIWSLWCCPASTRRSRCRRCWRPFPPAIGRWWSTTTAPMTPLAWPAGTALRCVVEPRPGYGSAVHAGVVAATTPIVAVIDADGSMDAGDLPRLVAALDQGADLVIGRRRPVPGLHWPWVARVGTVVMSWRLRTRHGLPVHDIAPMRVARREALLRSGCRRSAVGLSAGTAGPRRSRRLARGRARRQLRPPDGR